MCAYKVTLAVGDARRHDTGRRIRMSVIAPSRIDAAVIAEQAGNGQVSEYEYAYAKQVTPVVTRPAMAMAA